MKMRIMAGIGKIIDRKEWMLVIAGYLFAALYIGVGIKQNYFQGNPFTISKQKFVLIMSIVTGLGLLGILHRLGTPIIAKRIENELSKLHPFGEADDTPRLISVIKEGKILTYVFYSRHISLLQYQSNRDALETVLNTQIVSIEQGRDKRHTLIKGVSSRSSLPDIAEWKDSYLSNKDFELIMGVSLIGTESIDLNSTPHLLIGGGTGSGKSVLMKLLMMQCYMKGATVYIADFKGGVDYSEIWHRNCAIITEPKTLIDKLTKILQILECRKALLIDSKCSDISHYNKSHNEKINRVIIACDEVAEVLDKTGLSKDEKELVSQIESALSTIARLGRAFGIHLFLATQRPDADILKGQIKNNIAVRVCGRADRVLSNIILESPEAAEKIPQDGQGLFMMNNGQIFKAYLIDDMSIGQNAGEGD